MQELNRTEDAAPLAKEPAGQTTETPSQPVVAPPQQPSKWTAESEDGRFIVDCASDGHLLVIDQGMLKPDDDDNCDGMFMVARWDISQFLKMMRVAGELHRAERLAARRKAKAEKAAASRLA